MIYAVILGHLLFCPSCYQNESGLKALMEKVQQLEEETRRINEDVIVER
jgi:hypothetical protein